MLLLLLGSDCVAYLEREEEEVGGSYDCGRHYGVYNFGASAAVEADGQLTTGSWGTAANLLWVLILACQAFKVTG